MNQHTSLAAVATQEVDFAPTPWQTLEFDDGSVGVVHPEHEPDLLDYFVSRVWTVAMQEGGWRALIKVEVRH